MGQVRGIETVTTYDSKTGEFVINSPCESAQKYWIGGAANVKKISITYFVVFPSVYLHTCICSFNGSYFSTNSALTYFS